VATYIKFKVFQRGVFLPGDSNAGGSRSAGKYLITKREALFPIGKKQTALGILNDQMVVVSAYRSSAGNDDTRKNRSNQVLLVIWVVEYFLLTVD
jgi:hypothetical protein